VLCYNSQPSLHPFYSPFPCPFLPHLAGTPKQPSPTVNLIISLTTLCVLPGFFHARCKNLGVLGSVLSEVITDYSTTGTHPQTEPVLPSCPSTNHFLHRDYSRNQITTHPSYSKS
jgi:hypothetical protein